MSKKRKKSERKYGADLGMTPNNTEQATNTRSPRKELPISWIRQERGKKSNPKLLKAKSALYKSLKQRGYFKCD